MGNLATLLQALTVGAQTGLTFSADQANASAALQRGQLQSELAERNAKLAEMQRDDALNRGALEANRELGTTSQTVSSSRAALAAQGVDVGTGSAAAVTTSENLVGETDALTIRDNAAREAFGFDVSASNARLQGRLALLAGRNEAAADRLKGYSTLLSGATSIYNIYKTRAPTTTSTLPTGTRANDSDPSDYG